MSFGMGNLDILRYTWNTLKVRKYYLLLSFLVLITLIATFVLIIRAYNADIFFNS